MACLDYPGGCKELYITDQTLGIQQATGTCAFCGAAMKPEYYVGIGLCLSRIPVSSRQKISVSDGARRLLGMRDVKLVEVCPGQWPRGGVVHLSDALRRAEATGTVITRHVICADERDRLLDLQGR